MTYAQFRALFQAGSPISLAVIGDSTTSGFGANPGVNTWPGNGLSYGCMNNPAFGPNWTPGDPYYINPSSLISQAQQDNVGIPSAVRLLRTYVQNINPSSAVYNFGWSGATASTHVTGGTVALVAACVPKPEVVFINLGINSAKNGLSQDADLRTLVAEVLGNGMLPVIVMAHNIGVADSPDGVWSGTATPDQWYPMTFWLSTRANMVQIAYDNGLPLIDLGSPSGTINITELYDPFHPSNLGYQAIFQIYKSYLLSVGSGNGSVRIRNDPTNYWAQPLGALRLSSLPNMSLGLQLNSGSVTQIDTSAGVGSVK